MRQRATLLISLALLLFCCTAPSSIQAAAQPRGLAITPLRQYLKARASTPTDSTLTVSNLTTKPLHVTLSVQQFSLTDYTYNYQFTQPKNNWLHISMPSLNLQPQQTQTIAYSLDIPANTAPGGYYYTLLASSNLTNQGIDSTVQAADLLYVTVAGKLIHTSQLRTSSINRFSFGRPFTYQLDALNTGNIYFFAYTSGTLHGWTAKPALTASGHMLVPGTVRKLSGTINAPILPGIYRATYGYRTDSGENVRRTSLVLYIPPWSIAFLLALLLIGGSVLRNRHSPRAKKIQDSESDT